MMHDVELLVNAPQHFVIPCGVMAKTPAKKPRQGADRTKHDLIGTKKRDRYMSLVRKGFSPEQIACKLDSSRGRRYRKIRGEVLRTIATDIEFQAEMAAQAQGTLIMGVPPVAEALVKRGKRGRTDAAKLIFEASGFHNPKVKHEHSGDITVNLGSVPRPERVDNPAAQALEDGTVVDATVVEE